MSSPTKDVQSHAMTKGQLVHMESGSDDHYYHPPSGYTSHPLMQAHAMTIIWLGYTETDIRLNDHQGTLIKEYEGDEFLVVMGIGNKEMV